MINNRLYSSIIRPKTILHATANTTHKPDMVTRFMKNKIVGKICDIADKNPVMCQSIFSLAICCGARPATNYLITEDKKDAAYASCHSISSGVTGLIWPFLTATPLAAGVALVLKHPQKYLKPEIIKKFYPQVGLETIMENGKKITRVMTNTKGEMLRQDGSKLFRNLEPLKVKGDAEAATKIEELVKKINKTKNASKKASLEAEKEILEAEKIKFEKSKAAFEAANPKLEVDDHGIVRSKEVFKTEDGKFVIKNGKKVGCAVQKPEDKDTLKRVLDGQEALEVRPITEEMEIGANKEKNVKDMVNWVPDSILAVPRAWITIKLIPWLLKGLGMEKPKKKVAQTAQAAQTPQVQKNNIPAQKPAMQIKMNPGAFANIKAHSISAPKKGAA